MIYPKRLVFQERNQSHEISLVNSGKNTAQYQLSFVNYRMVENGKFEKIDTPDDGQLFSENNLRFFPRSVTLAPNEAQKVKVQVFRANQLETGEYRSHLYFRAVPKVKPLDKITDSEAPTGISTKIEMVFGISIPVIMEIGNPQVKSTLSNLKLDTTATNLNFTINREGNKSSYGDFKVTHIDPKGKVTEVGTVKGVAVYAPIPLRHFSIKLKDGIDYRSGRLNLIYLVQDGRKEKFAEASMVLN